MLHILIQNLTFSPLPPQNLISNLLQTHCEGVIEYVNKEPILFGDFRNALDETEVRLYEDLEDYTVCGAICQEVI